MSFHQKLTPILIVLVTLFFAGGTLLTETVDARAKIGGKSFSSAPKKTTTTQAAPQQQKSGSFAKGLAGGLLGGAIGGLLFGSMFGAGGSGMGILPILLLAGVGYFLYKKMSRANQPGYSQGQSGYGAQQGPVGGFGQTAATEPPPMSGSVMGVEAGIEDIRSHDRNFDPNYFKEIASDVFFQVQAGWMRRDLDSYRHLLGEQLTQEYADHFAEMREKGVINKLESIAIRKIDICDAGTTGSEDFVTVLFTANLLDYTVSDTTGDLVEGSMTEPVKFAEEWTWSRPVGTDNWKLEGIKLAE